MASCEYYIELISAGLDGQLSAEQERELADHLVSCPACRELGVQLAAAHAAFAGMEELEAPEGFARGVMERVRREEDRKPKVVPLFRRPQMKALASLAACAVLCVGLMNSGMFVGMDKAAEASTPAAAAPAAEAPAAMAPTAETSRSYGMEQKSAGAVQDQTTGMESATLPQETEPQNRRVIYSTLLSWSEELDAPRAVVVDEAEDLTALLQDGGKQAVILESWEEIFPQLDSGSYVAVIFTESSGSVTHALLDVTQDSVVISRNVPEAGTCDMAAYLWLFWTEDELPAGTELRVEFQNG